MRTANYFKRYEGIDGGNFIYWLVQHRSVAQFIEKYKIPAIEEEFLPMVDVQSAVKRTEASQPLPKPINFPGGIRVPHLHFKGELYLLTREQWKTFAGDAINSFQDKMGQANAISFNQLMEISEAVNTLT